MCLNHDSVREIINRKIKENHRVVKTESMYYFNVTIAIHN